MIYEYTPRPMDLFYRDQPLLAFSHEYSRCLDLRGINLVRAKVIGLPREQPLGRNEESSKGKFWVLRCSCGNYYMMRTRSIKRAMREKLTAMCPYCRHIESLNREYNK